MEGAFEIFYNQLPARPVTDPRHLEEFYLKYKDAYSDMILVDGVSAFCDDLQVRISSQTLEGTLLPADSILSRSSVDLTLSMLIRAPGIGDSRIVGGYAAKSVEIPSGACQERIIGYVSKVRGYWWGDLIYVTMSSMSTLDTIHRLVF